MKQCSQCKKTLTLIHFYKNKSNKDGYHFQCRSCHRKTNNRNKQTKLDFYHRDKQKNPIRYLLKFAKRRSIQKNLVFDLSESDIRIPEKCPFLNQPLIWGHDKYAPSIDRIDPSKGYTKDNIQVISKLANCMKWNSSKEELIQFAKAILERSNMC